MKRVLVLVAMILVVMVSNVMAEMDCDQACAAMIAATISADNPHLDLVEDACVTACNAHVKGQPRKTMANLEFFFRLYLKQAQEWEAKQWQRRK